MARKRRIFSASLKAKVALEAIKGQRTINEIAGVHEVHPSMVTRWKKEAIAGLSEVFSTSRARANRADEALKASLYQQIGQMKVELDWIKKNSGFTS